MNRQQSIDDRRNRIEARLTTATAVATDAELDSSLLHYANGAAVPLAILSLAAVAMPEAAEAAEMLRHGRRAEFVGLSPHPDIERIFHTERATLAAVPVPELVGQLWPGAQLAKRKGAGWGHYPIVAGGDMAKGSKIVWRVSEGDTTAKRSILPTTPEHQAICRICNQILAEAESTTLRVLTMTSGEATKAKERWKKRDSVRWFPIPQHMGQVVMIHGEEKEGGDELGAMCDGYGKAALFALVAGWMANKPEGKRAKGVSGWGKRYRMAKGHNEESLAEQEGQRVAMASGKAGKFSLTSLSSPYAIAGALSSTVDGGGHGLDVTTSIQDDVETLLQLELVQPLKVKAYANLERVEAILKGNQNEVQGEQFPFKGHNINTNTMSLKRENEPKEGEKRGGALPFPSLQEAVAQRIWDTWQAIASETASEARVMVTA